MVKKELSVIIPVYNTEKYFEKCINSVIRAIEKCKIDSEIIVINDGSKGNINEIIQNYLKKYPELIKFIFGENKGRGATRNIGLSFAIGKYISFIDSDDYIDENMYVEAFDEFNNSETEIVIFDFENIDYKNKKNNFIVEAKESSYIDDKLGCLDNLILPSCCNKVIKKELFTNLSFPQYINYEDLATIPVVVLKARKISYIAKPLYKYVQNDESIMHENYGVKQLDLINALEIVCKRIDELNLSEEFSKKVKYMIYTRRFYEEILEKIVFCDNKSEILKVFCDKIKIIDNKFWNNEYFVNLVYSQGNLRKNANKLLHKAIQKNKYSLLNIFLTKRLYYMFFAIRYTNIVEEIV